MAHFTTTESAVPCLPHVGQGHLKVRSAILIQGHLKARFAILIQGHLKVRFAILIQGHLKVSSAILIQGHLMKQAAKVWMDSPKAVEQSQCQ